MNISEVGKNSLTPRIVRSPIVGSGKAVPPSSVIATMLGLLRTFSLKEFHRKWWGNADIHWTAVGVQKGSPSELPGLPISNARRLNAQLWGWPKKQPKNKSFWAGYSWDIRDPEVGISRSKTLCKWPFSLVLHREWPGRPCIWVGTPRIWKKKTLCKKTLGWIIVP